ncbi:DUF5074 domain-containing protein [Aquimarina gracilis]|uniref:DUF5074 domain-containing protein n=1 Tax=Aquimarina gracilis TaxID=874422 RepID=A0ABU5ZUY0_9FLAO|nr:DUF5074 domain-containing protein [Aquimarina gracilis]MEB3345890.1 DUF5074 domain-containing protein [Aquimarina gracilis]
MKLNTLFLSIFTLGILLVSCSSDDDGMELPKGDFDNGILISHEGTFGGVTGSVSFIPNDFSTIQNDIYNATNGEDLGVFQQSIGFNGDLAFIVVDNANTITVVNRYTFEKVSTITTGLSTPRYITFFNNKGYVTNWGDTASSTDDFIAVVNLTDYTVESTTIPVSEGPEQILERNGNLYVSHKGGFGFNNVVTVINTSNNQTQELIVGDKPDELAFDTAGDLWVLCEGRTTFDADFNIIDQTPGTLVKINTTTNVVDTTINFEGTNQPSLMTYSNGTIYFYLNSAVYSMSETSTTLPTASIISGDFDFYGMQVNENKLYAVDAGDFASSGIMKVFDLSNNQETNSMTVGIVPAKIYFN